MTSSRRGSAALLSSLLLVVLAVACATSEPIAGIDPPAVVSVSLTPPSVTVQVGQSTPFSIFAHLSSGDSSAVAASEAQWTADGGTISPAGVYTAGNAPGSFRVIATQTGGTLADTAAVTVTSGPPVLSAVILTPASVSLGIGATRQFTASGRLSDGSAAAVTVTYSATGGTISAGGLYTAGTTAGSFRVIATQQGGTLADTSAVTITAATTLQQVILTPASASIVTAGSLQFTVSGRMSDGSTSVPAVGYVATGGTISAGGLYTAGSTLGSFQVIATQTGGTLADTAAVTIAAAPPPGTVLFSSDWSSGTGTTDAVLRDTSKPVAWGSRWGDNGLLAVVSAAGLGFPATMANVLRVQMGTGSFDWMMVKDAWAAPAVGSSLAFRLYLRNDVANTVSGGYASTHPVESEGDGNGVSGNYYAMHLGSNTNGTFPWMLDVGGYGHQLTTPDQTGSNPGNLQKFMAYRLEWKFTRTGTSTYNVDMRIYDAAGALLFDRNTITVWGGGTIAGGGGNGVPLDDSHIREFRVGINGGFGASGTQYVYWGGFAVCANDWCGPYGAS